jgi:hypothetical protein
MSMISGSDLTRAPWLVGGRNGRRGAATGHQSTGKSAKTTLMECVLDGQLGTFNVWTRLVSPRGTLVTLIVAVPDAEAGR